MLLYRLIPIILIFSIYTNTFISQNPELVLPVGHTGRIVDIKISKNGKYAVTGGDDQVVILWNLESGKIIKRFTEIPNSVLSLDIDPNFKYIAVGTKSSVTRLGNTGVGAVLLEIATGKTIHVFDDLPYEVKDVAFSPDGKKLALGSTVWLYQYHVPSMELINKFKAGKDGLLSLIVYVEQIEYTKDGNQIITNYPKGWATWDATSGKRLNKFKFHEYDANNIVISIDNRYMVTTCMDKTLAIWDLTTGTVVSNISGDVWYFGKIYLSADNKYLVYSLFNNTSMIEAFDLSTGEKILSLNGARGEFSGVSLIKNNTELVTIGAIDFKTSTFQKFKFPSGEKIGEFTPPANTQGEKWTTISAFKKENSMLTGSTKGMLVKWNLENVSPSFSTRKNDAMISDIIIDEKQGRILTGGNDGLIYSYTINGLEIGSFGNTSSSTVSRMLTHDERFAGSSSGGVSYAASTGISCMDIDDSYSSIIIGNYTGETRLFDLKTEQSTLIQKGNKTKRNLRHDFWVEYEGGTVTGVDMGKSPQKYAYSNYFITEYHSLGQMDMALSDSKTTTFNLNGTRQQLKKHNGIVRFSPDDEHAVIAKQRVLYSYDLKNDKIEDPLFIFDDAILDLSYSNDGTKLAIVGRSQEIALYDAITLKLIYKVPAHGANITGVSFTKDDEFLVTSSLDYSSGVWKVSSGDKTLSLYVFKDEEWIAVTPEGYYFATKGATKKLNYVIGLNVHPFEQFDLKYNRPDLVLKQMGYAEKELIRAYHNAYEKRLKRLGFTEEMLQDDFNLPSLEINKFEFLPTQLDKSSLELNLNIKDSQHPIDRINVWVNDVAVFGTNGIDVRKENKKELDKTIQVPLAKGSNKIQVSVLNQAGVESYKQTHEVNCSVGSDKPDLYIISIGDSKYKQVKYNLTYASKDAKDIAELFTESAVYENVHSKILIDKNVTHDNIIGLKSFFDKANINDHVIIFLAGHGVLSADLDYYLATYYMDFNQPEKYGLAYEDLENLLDGIKPLKKTLILDACHSGEIDKEEMELAAAEMINEGDVQFRTVGNAVKSKLGSQNTLELTKSLFTDLRRGTGATVISSAGGMEYAMESGEWQNGLFTFALINGIKSGEADLNQDGEIWLSEIQEYVGKTVTDLSHGKQQPTSRIENQMVDFRVW